MNYAVLRPWISNFSILLGYVVSHLLTLNAQLNEDRFAMIVLRQYSCRFEANGVDG